jgi:hypothetical protein
MPLETIVVVAAIAATFAFFGGLLLFTDLTWNRTTARRRR